MVFGRAVLPLLLLAACGTTELFDVYDVPEAPGTAEAPWPRLADTPEPPPPGVYTAALPDPAAGIAAGTALGIASREAAARAEALSAPVIAEGALRPRPRTAKDPAVDQAALRARAAAAAARAERLSRPVLSEAERERLLSAAR